MSNQTSEEKEVQPLIVKQSAELAVEKSRGLKKTRSDFGILPITLDTAKIAESLKTSRPYIKAMTKINTRQVGGRIKDEVIREHAQVSFEHLKKSPRYYLRRRALWNWFIMSPEDIAAYRKLTVNECLVMDRKEAALVAKGELL